jgi:hypothetical protein
LYRQYAGKVAIQTTVRGGKEMEPYPSQWEGWIGRWAVLGTTEFFHHWKIIEVLRKTVTFRNIILFSVTGGKVEF